MHATQLFVILPNVILSEQFICCSFVYLSAQTIGDDEPVTGPLHSHHLVYLPNMAVLTWISLISRYENRF